MGRALEKAERYRLLNEPGEAESICLDILHVDPENQQALITLLLARTDEFDQPTGDVARAQEVVPRLKGAYEQAYYAGIVLERKARAQLRGGQPRHGPHGPGRVAPGHGALREGGRRSVPRATTTRCCAGTRAPACSSACPAWRSRPRSTRRRWSERRPQAPGRLRRSVRVPPHARVSVASVPSRTFSSRPAA